MNVAIEHFVAPVAHVRAEVPSTIRTWHGVRAVNGRDGPGGDRVFVLPLSSGRSAIAVIDVAGHGMARAPLSSVIAGTIIASLLRNASPAMALGCADERLRTFDDELPNAVAFVALVHPILRTVVYASAGHDVAFTIADDGHTRDLASTTPMLGIPLTVHACDAVFTLAPLETLVIATDGVSDSRPTGSRNFFGVCGIARTVVRSLHNGSDPAWAVLQAACTHAHGTQADDYGVVVARINAATGRARHGVRHRASRVHASPAV